MIIRRATATDLPGLNRLLEQTRVILQDIDTRLQPHDFRMVRSDGHTNLIFDVALPSELADRKKEIRRTVESRLSQQEGTDIYAVSTFEPAAFNA